MEVRSLRAGYARLLWAMENVTCARTNRGERKFARCAKTSAPSSGSSPRLVASAARPVLLWTTNREERRLGRGKTYEPPTASSDVTGTGEGRRF